jgi:hypothetical protein
VIHGLFVVTYVATMSVIDTPNRLKFDPALPSVQVHLKPYSNQVAKELIANVTREFGHPGVRWNWTVNTTTSQFYNDWVLDFWFKDPNDALVFGLKYQQ